jgi:hypothetical protein
MSRKLVGEMKVDVPYIMKETNDSEIIFSIHFPFQNQINTSYEEKRIDEVYYLLVIRYALRI